jgi:hypothetical protein
VNRLLLVVVLGLAAAALTSAAAADRGKQASSPLTAVDSAGGAMAAGLSWTPKACEGATLWSPGERAAWTFRLPRPCPATSTGRGVSAVSSTGFRVAFLSYVGGNTREWRLWTATRTAHTPRLVRSASADAGDPSPILLGNGGDGGIPYAVGRTVVVLNDRGTRNLTWTAPRQIAVLNATHFDLAVTLADGGVVVVGAQGKRTTTYPGLGARDAQAILGGVVYETPSQIVLRKGKVTRILTTTPGARLVDYVDGTLLYLVHGALHSYAWQTRKDLMLRRIPRPYLVDGDRHMLAWASGSRLCSAVFWGSSRPFPRDPGCSY